tara:strand:+ start:1832 stop:2053 length:222 start_codon:yes stop_codon:yes gene_type:complete
MNFKKRAVEALTTKAKADVAAAAASLSIMLDNPAGIGDHSTSDLHNNLNDSLQALADAEGRLETLQRNPSLFD